jgi:hypothetical protein
LIATDGAFVANGICVPITATFAIRLLTGWTASADGSTFLASGSPAGAIFGVNVLPFNDRTTARLVPLFCAGFWDGLVLGALFRDDGTATFFALVFFTEAFFTETSRYAHLASQRSTR